MAKKMYKVLWCMDGQKASGVDYFHSLEIAKAFLMEDCTSGAILDKGEVIYERAEKVDTAEKMQ